MSPERGEAISVWIVDRQDYRCRLTADALERAGFSIQAYSQYKELFTERDELGRSKPDLVLLSCAASQEEEQTLLSVLVRSGCPVLVLVSFLSTSEARELFLLGAADVVTRPPKMEELLSIIHSDLETIARKRERVWSL